MSTAKAKQFVAVIVNCDKRLAQVTIRSLAVSIAKSVNLRELRESAGLKPEELAFRLDIGYSTVRNWEIGRHEPRLPITKVPSLLQLYNCSLETLPFTATPF